MATPSRPDKVVVSVSFVQKNPDLTLEQFYHHWEHVHGPLVKPWALKHGIINYTQVHATPALNKDAAPMGPESVDAKVALADYHGCAFIEVPDMDILAKAFKDEYYLNVIEPDERKFINKKLGVLRVRGESKKII